MSLPFDPQAGLIVVPVRLWGPDGDTIAHLALDTGATRSLVNWDIAVLLGYDPDNLSHPLPHASAKRSSRWSTWP